MSAGDGCLKRTFVYQNERERKGKGENKCWGVYNVDGDEKGVQVYLSRTV